MLFLHYQIIRYNITWLEHRKRTLFYRERRHQYLSQRPRHCRPGPGIQISPTLCVLICPLAWNTADCAHKFSLPLRTWEDRDETCLVFLVATWLTLRTCLWGAGGGSSWCCRESPGQWPDTLRTSPQRGKCRHWSPCPAAGRAGCPPCSTGTRRPPQQGSAGLVNWAGCERSVHFVFQ